jgi:uncharacterized YccA/Bax inhibitor family protein
MERTSSNPVLKEVFDRRIETIEAGVMSFNGVVNKTATLLSLVLIFAGGTWVGLQSGYLPGTVFLPLTIVAIIAQLIMTFVMIKKPTMSRSLSIAYAMIEGVVIGAISLFYNTRYPGIVFNAMVLTAGAVLAMLFFYKTQLIRATENLKLMIGAATMAIAMTYLVAFGLSLFNVPVPLIHDSSPIGIAFSVFVLGVAVFNLVLDFDQIERGVEQRAPEYMEWYCSFGLMVTIMWVYIEMLRLLSKLQKK